MTDVESVATVRSFDGGLAAHREPTQRQNGILRDSILGIQIQKKRNPEGVPRTSSTSRVWR